MCVDRSGGEPGRTCAGYPPSVQVLSYRDWYALDLYTYLEATVRGVAVRKQLTMGTRCSFEGAARARAAGSRSATALLPALRTCASGSQTCRAFCAAMLDPA